MSKVTDKQMDSIIAKKMIDPTSIGFRFLWTVGFFFKKKYTIEDGWNYHGLVATHYPLGMYYDIFWLHKNYRFTFALRKEYTMIALRHSKATLNDLIEYFGDSLGPVFLLKEYPGWKYYIFFKLTKGYHNFFRKKYRLNSLHTDCLDEFEYNKVRFPDDYGMDNLFTADDADLNLVLIDETYDTKLGWLSIHSTRIFGSMHATRKNEAFSFFNLEKPIQRAPLSKIKKLMVSEGKVTCKEYIRKTGKYCRNKVIKGVKYCYRHK